MLVFVGGLTPDTNWPQKFEQLMVDHGPRPILGPPELACSLAHLGLFHFTVRWFTMRRICLTEMRITNEFRPPIRWP